MNRFVFVGLDKSRETRSSHIVVGISGTARFRHASRVPFGLSTAYNWIYQVKVETDEWRALVAWRWHEPLGRRTISAKRKCRTRGIYRTGWFHCIALARWKSARVLQIATRWTFSFLFPPFIVIETKQSFVSREEKINIPPLKVITESLRMVNERESANGDCIKMSAMFQLFDIVENHRTLLTLK